MEPLRPRKTPRPCPSLTLRIGQPQHQPQVLYRGTRGALSQIVETRDKNRLRVFVVRKDIELESIGLVQRLGFDPSALRSLGVGRHDRDIRASRVTLYQRGVEIRRIRLDQKSIKFYRHRDQNALPEITDRRNEDRPAREL